MIDERRQMRDGDDAHGIDGRGLVGVGLGDDDLPHALVATEGRRDGERASHGSEGAVEGELADEDASGDLLGTNVVGGLQKSDGDRKVEGRAFLLHVSG